MHTWHTSSTCALYRILSSVSPSAIEASSSHQVRVVIISGDENSDKEIIVQEKEDEPEKKKKKKKVVKDKGDNGDIENE